MLFRHDGLTFAPQGSTAPSGFVVERPAPGLARGKYPASPVLIAALGVVLVLTTVVYFLLRSRKLRQ